MPRFKVYVKIDVEDQRGTVVVDAEDADTAGECAEELWEENPERFMWEPEDLTKPDLVDVVRIEEIDG